MNVSLSPHRFIWSSLKSRCLSLVLYVKSVLLKGRQPRKKSDEEHMEENQQKNRYKLATKRPSTLFLLVLFALPQSIIVSITSIFQKIAADFCVSQQSVHFLISYGLLGYAIGPLFAGPIGKLFGRKTTIFSGLTIAIFGVCLKLLTYYLRTFSLFVLGHFLSVFGGAFCAVAVYAIIHDYYYFKEAKRVLAFIVGGLLLVPGVMVTLCSVIACRYHWIDIQYLLIAFFLIIGLIAIKHPETRQIIRPQHVRIRKIFKDYGTTISNPLFLYFSILIGTSVSMLYLFISEGPIIALQQLKISPSLFGYLAFVPYVGGAASLFIAGKLSHSIRVYKILVFTLVCVVILNVTFFAFSLFYGITVFSLFFFSFLIISLTMPINVSGVSLLHHYVRDRSNTSALLVTFFITIVMLIVYISGLIRPSIGPMTYPLMLLIAAVFLVLDYVIIKILVKRYNNN